MRARPSAQPSVDARLLTAIHAWGISRGPRLQRLVPAKACEGDPVVFVGGRLDGGGLTAHFGSQTTWAVALSDRAALSCVPPGTSAGPVSLSRQGLRSNSLAFGGPSDDEPGRFVRVEPGDGASGVFRDTPVVGRLSHPGDPESLNAETFRVLDPRGTVPARLRWSPDNLVVIWQAERLLDPGVPHFVVCSGLLDARGRPVEPHLSRFLPCDLVRDDLPSAGDGFG